ncbi:MAG: glycosyltransferase [Candidatus Caenarcaniphilales bacterium]|nr:glycosyltransferase [Candidatus Caenarcaniphilales bacterium]
MLITILTTGTRGDTQPYIALGLKLKASGHTVRIAAFENFGDFIKSFGLEFYPVEGDISKFVSSKMFKDAMSADNPLKFFKSLSNKEFNDALLGVQRDLFNACEGSNLIVYHPGAPIGYFVAQKLGIPCVLASPFPMSPTKEYPSLIFYDGIRLGKLFNYLTHKVFENGFWFAIKSPLEQYWKQLHGSAPKNFSCPYDKQNTKRFPTVTSCSNYDFPGPKDWPRNVYSDGYWFLDEEKEWEPPKELTDFLQKGPPPVYIGFGSVVDIEKSEETTGIIIEALKLSKQRGVLATGWNGTAKLDKVSDDLFILESAPHSWLFPLMSAVVHHGGAGTTAAGLRAGVPSIIIPHSNDQFAWGRRVHELGVGPKAIPRKKLTAQNLSAAINEALADGVKEKAKKLGEQIRSEKGAEKAAQIIIDVLEKEKNEAK